MSQNERIGIAAHLHVALRRKAGRVTDIDWMAVNDEYAREVLRIAKAKGMEDGDTALLDLAYKFEAQLPPPVIAGAPAPAPAAEPVPLVDRLAHSLRETARHAEADDSRYIGGLR